MNDWHLRLFEVRLTQGGGRRVDTHRFRTLADAEAFAARHVVQPPQRQVFAVEIRDLRKPAADQLVWTYPPGALAR
jgi:hypothetical protein